jgi:nucleoside phosphorylase
MFLEDYKKNLDGNYILILTSNNKEKEAINKIINNKVSIRINKSNKGAYLGMISNTYVIHISGESGSISNTSISNVCKAFLSDSLNPSPKLIVLSGICWGNPKKTNLGETII